MNCTCREPLEPSSLVLQPEQMSTSQDSRGPPLNVIYMVKRLQQISKVIDGQISFNKDYKLKKGRFMQIMHAYNC